MKVIISTQFSLEFFLVFFLCTKMAPHLKVKKASHGLMNLNLRIKLFPLARSSGPKLDDIQIITSDFSAN